MDDIAKRNTLTTIHQLLLQYFSEPELKDICFKLGFSYEDLGGSGRSDKARELVTYLNRRDRLPELQQIVQQERPQARWPGALAMPPLAELPINRWQLTAEDFDHLVTILQGQPQFATPERRLDFLNELFAGTPRQKDILGLFDVSGAPRSVAVRLVNRLIQFGQDIPGRETLGLLVHALLTGYGVHPDADFLRALINRYPLGISVSVEPARPKPLALALPPIRERFLAVEDRNWLARAMGNLSRFQDLPGRRNLLIDSQIPDGWIGEISLDRGGVMEVAKTIINDLELRGPLPQNPQKHALGGLLEALLDSFGVEDARRDVALQFRYKLNIARAEIDRLSERFGVPLILFEEDKAPSETQLSASLPAAWLQVAPIEKLEALFANGRENWLDINFLVAGARAAQAVCRLEWNKRGQGTGFLVAPDLVLTNYHVCCPPEYQGALESRLRACEVRFGAYGTPEGGVSAGNRVAKLHQAAVVASSEIDLLDYMLLRLREPVEDGARIVRATLSEEAMYEEQYANIIQHPLGGAMKVALRYNQIVKVMPQRVYYLSDTLEGSSGSPVFDDAWQVIALHRAAGLKDETGQIVTEANEGVPILDILHEIRSYLGGV